MPPSEVDHHREETQEQQHNHSHTLWRSTVKLEGRKAGILRRNHATRQHFSEDVHKEGSSGRCCFQFDFLLSVSAAAGLCLACTDNPPITAAAERSCGAEGQPTSVCDCDSLFAIAAAKDGKCLETNRR